MLTSHWLVVTRGMSRVWIPGPGCDMAPGFLKIIGAATLGSEPLGTQ